MTYEEYVHAAMPTSHHTWFFLHTKRPIVSTAWVRRKGKGIPLRRMLNVKPNAIYHRW